MRDLSGLVAANDSRREAGCERRVAAARAALPHLIRQRRTNGDDPMLQRYVDACRARLYDPHLSLRQIAAKRGEPKDVYAGLLRRAIAHGQSR